MTTSTPAPPTTPTRASPLPVALLTTLFVAGVLAWVAFLVTHPPVDHHLYEYDTIAPVRDAWWWRHFYLGGFGYPLAFGGLGGLVVVACRGRGRSWAAVAALLLLAGGLLSGLGFAAEGVAWAYATDPAVVDEATGTRLLAAYGDHPARIDVPVLLGFALATVGVAVVLVALRRAGLLPWPLLAVAVAALLLQLVPLPHALEPVKAVVQAGVLLLLGLVAARAALTDGSRDAPG